MATHSSVLTWRIPGTGEHGGLPTMGSHRVGHDWSDLASAAAAARNLEKLMNLFSGKEWRLRYREWICGYSGEGESETNGK